MITIRVDRAKTPIETTATAEQLRDSARMAINDTVKDMRVQAWRHINRTVAIKKQPNSPRTPKQIVESRIKLSFARRGETTGGIEIKATSIPLVWFDPKEKRVARPARSEGDRRGKKTPRGRRSTETSVKIEKGSARTVIPGAFGPSIEKLGKTVWRRQGKARKPLEKPAGVEIPMILRRRGGVQELTAKAEERLSVNLVRRIKRLKYWWGKRQNQK